MFSIMYDDNDNFVLSDVTNFNLTAMDTQDGVQALDSVREFIAACSMASKADYLEWRRMYKKINHLLTDTAKLMKKLRKTGTAKYSPTFRVFQQAYNRTSRMDTTQPVLDDAEMLRSFERHRLDVHLWVSVALHELYNARQLYKLASCEAYRRVRMKSGVKTDRKTDYTSLDAGFVSSV